MANRIYRYAAFTFFFLFLLAGGAVEASERVTAEELKHMLDSGEKVVLIDVRTPAEHKAGHIPGSVHMPLGTLHEVEKLPEGGRIVLYCRGGVRSLKAKKILEGKGYTGLVDLEGGITAWEAAGGKVVPGK